MVLFIVLFANTIWFLFTHLEQMLRRNIFSPWKLISACTIDVVFLQENICGGFFLSYSVKARKGSLGHKHRFEAETHGNCKLCSSVHSNPVCGSDGHTYSSKVKFPDVCLPPFKKRHPFSEVML